MLPVARKTVTSAVEIAQNIEIKGMTDRQSFFSVTFISKRRTYSYSFSYYIIKAL